MIGPATQASKPSHTKAPVGNSHAVIPSEHPGSHTEPHGCPKHGSNGGGQSMGGDDTHAFVSGSQ